MLNDLNQLVLQYEQDPASFQSKIIGEMSNEMTLSFSSREAFLILHYYFSKNEINRALQSCKDLINQKQLFEFISRKTNFDDFLTKETPFPPFDLFLICALLSYEGTEPDVQNIYYRLFEFHRTLLSKLKDSEYATVWMNDLFEPQQKTKEEAIQIENKRVLYLIEFLVVLYHSMPPNQLLSNFIDTTFYKKQEVESNDEINTMIGRVLLSNGDVEKAQDFFDQVSNNTLKKMNEAFITFFRCNYIDAEKAFAEIDDPIAKVNRSASLVFLGKIEEAKKVLKDAIAQEPSLQYLNSVNDNLTFLKEITGETTDFEQRNLDQNENQNESLYNFPINSLSVRIPH